MSQENEVKVTVTLEDTFLDLQYYKVQIQYWDKEVINKKLQPCFKIGSLLLNIMNELDCMNKQLSIEFKIKNNPKQMLELQYISGQKISKRSITSIARGLTDTEKEAKAIKDFIKYHNCTFN